MKLNARDFKIKHMAKICLKCPYPDCIGNECERLPKAKKRIDSYIAKRKDEYERGLISV